MIYNHCVNGDNLADNWLVYNGQLLTITDHN